MTALPPAEDSVHRAGYGAPHFASGMRGPAWRYFDGTDEEKALGLFSLLDANGEAHPDDVANISRDLAISIYKGMLTVRVVDRRMMNLQRQGRIGFYAVALGQEAGVIGSAAAMEPQDWMVPALREAGAGMYRGLSLSRYVAQCFGNGADVMKGRQMPCHPSDREHHYVNMSSCVSSQIPHAVGVAMGMKIAGDVGRVCFGFMGEGGTSAADFHTSLNFAGVTGAPVVLVCQNNQWAISTPHSIQTASATFAIKGLGYGLESLRVDGNDPFAVYSACRYAADKARRGGGPTFLELLTYRVSAHTSSDDPSRYRDESVTEEWRTRKDPLVRTMAFLERRGWFSRADSEAFEKELEVRVDAVVAEQEQIGPPLAETLVEDVFETIPWHLREQRGEWLDDEPPTS